jgi:hypothetical protein
MFTINLKVSLIVIRDFDYSLYIVQDLFLNYFPYYNFKKLQIQLETNLVVNIENSQPQQAASRMMMW